MFSGPKWGAAASGLSKENGTQGTEAEGQLGFWVFKGRTDQRGTTGTVILGSGFTQ